MKAYIIAEGEVQGVGYRHFVYRVANELGAKGFVRNLPGGKVDVFCICEGEAQLKEFLKRIDRKSTSFFGINVSSLKIFREGDKQFKDFGGFRGFEVRF
ncbi:acylphosphatase [Candidatus Micrarchaeota archaeon]|nr:acylphosphatase [Candidatus Micrarchaeota archaeon]